MSLRSRVQRFLEGASLPEPVRAEIVAAIYPRSFRIGTSIAASSIFGLIMIAMVGGPLPIVWTVGALLLCAYRTLDWRAYRRMPSAKRSSEWARGFTIRFLPFGLWWGAAAAVFAISDQPLVLLIAVLSAEGMNAGAACSYGVHPPAALAFVLPTSILFFLAGAFYGGFFGFAVCFVELVLCLNYLVIIREFHRAMTGAIRLRHEREALVERLAAANEAAAREIRAKTEFLATLSHEIRTPMNALLGAVQTIDEPGLPSRARSMLDVAKRGGARLAALIDDVLEFERLGAGPLPIASIAFDPALLVRDAVELMRPWASAHGLTLRVCDGPAPLPMLQGDPRRIEQILLNLVSNAIRHVDSGPVDITIGCVPAEEGRLLELDVRDYGPGIPDAVLARLFQPFAQGARHGEGRQAGSGLGLAIAHRLASAMGGKLLVETGPSGSALRLVLPLQLAAAGMPAARALPDAAEPTPLGLNVLLVEDDELSSVVVVAMLERLGCRATHVATGEAAIAACGVQAFDVVLMDMQLPGMSGLDAARTIRAAMPRPRLIAMTANATLAHVETYRREQFDGFVPKPLREEALRRTLSGGEAAFGDLQPTSAALIDAALWRRLARDFDRDGADRFRRQACEVITLYLSDLAAAGAQNNRQATIRAAHALAGAAGSSGLLALAGAASAIERAAAEQDPSSATLGEIETLGRRSLDALGSLRIAS
jgi:signal transduction histidine kinase/CheY-like chemotaxis protein